MSFLDGKIEQPSPIINGHEYSFASIELDVNGMLTPGATSINYWDRKKPGIIMDTAGRKVGRTPGVDERGCELVMLRRFWDALRTNLGQSFGLRVFTISVMYHEPGFPALGVEARTVIDVLDGCRITDVEPNNQEGNQAATVTLKIDPMTILWDSGGSEGGIVMDGLGARRDTIGPNPRVFRVPEPGEV